jgi:hypothetical protein
VFAARPGVRAAGTVADPSPPVVPVIPWPALVAWGAGMFTVLAVTGWLGTRALIASEGADGPPRERGPEGGTAAPGSVGR